MLCAGTSFAQYEPMFTQYSFNEMFINPAYSGSHEALSLSALYRKQWQNIEGAPVTKTFTAHAPVMKNKVGLGLTVYSDAIGVTNQNGVFVNYAYRIRLNKGTLALGVLGGVDGIQESLLNVNTTDGSDRHFSANTGTNLAPNFGTGLYYATGGYYLSFSVPRLLINKLVLNQNLEVERVTSSFRMEDLHYFLASGYVFNVNPMFKIKPSFMVKTVVNAPIEYDLNMAFFMNNVLWLGAGYRSGDAVNALIAVHPMPQIRIGYSYDYSISTLRKYNAGSHEFSINYMFNYYKKRITSPRYF